MKIKRQDGSGTFLLKVSDTDEDCSVCNFAIVTISKSLKEKINLFKKTIEEIKATGISIYRMTAFDSSVRYLSECEYGEYETISDELAEELADLFEEGEEVVEIDANTFPDNLPTLREEGSQVIVDDFGVIFDAYVKHTNTRMYTEKITHTQLGL